MALEDKEANDEDVEQQLSLSSEWAALDFSGMFLEELEEKEEQALSGSAIISAFQREGAHSGSEIVGQDGMKEGDEEGEEGETSAAWGNFMEVEEREEGEEEKEQEEREEETVAESREWTEVVSRRVRGGVDDYQRRKPQGKIPCVKSSEMLERQKQREKWKAASRAYRERKKMANAVLEMTPPSVDNIPADLINVDVAQEQPENAGQPVVGPLPLNEDFNPPVSSTPERDQRRNVSSAEKCNKRLQKEKRKLKKQVLKLRKQLAEPVKVDLSNTVCHTEDPSSPPEPPKEQASLQDLSGKFVIVTQYRPGSMKGQLLSISSGQSRGTWATRTCIVPSFPSTKLETSLRLPGEKHRVLGSPRVRA
ncbi:hypothetical protein Q8A67_006341 [Cirrhinus molitorella]|uniref:Uncharacterized protein n=1 Tax=Cirrhinus molitorella TaxID=172907 RepID=A0AA88Q1W6_9TELE|nr:hypothetical protein Q8A67_006341 [Cirrhinus molitorella]